jgi:Bacterial Ig-like domain (group 3)
MSGLAKLRIAIVASLIALTSGLQAQSPSPSNSNTNVSSVPQLKITNTALTSDSASISISMPETPAKFSVHLNGKDVSSRFSSADCKDAICKTATLTQADGFTPQKNVLTLDAGHGVTGRLRFGTNVSSPTSSGSVLPQARPMALTSSVTPKAQTVGADYSSALPPTVAFTTLTPGGWQQGANPWFSVNGVTYPATTPANSCSGDQYLAISLDRQTLQEKIDAPENSPMCLANSAAVTTYLATLSANDIVIVGSISGTYPAKGLDLTSIGGNPAAVSGIGGGVFNLAYPAAVITIGTPGAAAGSAYMGYSINAPGFENIPVFANGTLQEDAYGNYNFQSGDVAEFVVSPNDIDVITSPSDTHTSAVSISIPGAAPNAVQNIAYTPPVGVDSGYWLLILSRNTLKPQTGTCSAPTLSPDGSTEYISGCGVFYRTNSGVAADETANYQALATALDGVNPFQLAFLVTAGQAADGGTNNSVWNVAGFNPFNNVSNGFLEFSNALSQLGGTSNLTQYLLSPTSAYTFIGSPGLGGPLTGSSIESTTVLPVQGQTGFVHGLLQRDFNGLYVPGQTNQEPTALYVAKGALKDPEYKLTEVALQQPMDWPSSSTTTLLPGGYTLYGQVSAYKYLSYVLLNTYIQGIQQNSHIDDIHYFFTGSYNNLIDYHSYNAASASFPSTTSAYPCDSVTPTGPTIQCTINSFVGDGQTLIFTQLDFAAVQKQLSTEIQDLTNTLQFLVIGPNSMKSVITSSSSNVGLALNNAAANILASTLQPVPPQTVVKTSWQNIVGMIGGVASIFSAVPGIGEIAGIALLATNGAKLFGGIASAVGGAASLASDAGQITTSSTSSVLPNPQMQFQSTIANLANGYLQNQLSGGFDAMADSITSDWGRLSILGPMTVDPNNTVFFSPTYSAETLAVSSLTQAASRSFYMSLMPAIGYGVDYYPAVHGWSTEQAGQQNIPDMGVYSSSGTLSTTYHCKAYYLQPQENTTAPTFNDTGTTITAPGSGLGAPVANIYTWYPTIGGVPSSFPRNRAGNPDATTTEIDMFVIAGKVSYPNTTSVTINVPTAQLTNYLFTNSGLNLPVSEFTSISGPLASTFTNMAVNNRAQNDTNSICGSYWYPTKYPVSDTPSTTNPSAGTPGESTTITLTVASTDVLGDDLPVSATVTAGSTPATSGSVYFTVDGAGQVNANVNAQGVASTVIPTAQLTRGAHQIVALYSGVTPFEPSTSVAATTTVYTTAPDINLSASTSSVNVSYGSISSPVTLQLTSLAGLAGAVNLSCAGLPVGMSCSFNPTQMALSANGQATVSMTINGGNASSSSFWIPGVGLVLLPFSLVCLNRVRKGGHQIGGIICLLVLSFVGIACLSGCSGGSSPSSNSFQETGSKTVLISASCGTVNTTVPIEVNIQ